MAKVLIADKAAAGAVSAARQILQEAGLGVEYLKNGPKEIDELEPGPLEKRLGGVKYIIGRSGFRTVGEGHKFVDAANDLSLVVRAGSGTNNHDGDYLVRKNVILENTPGRNANAVAELALAYVLAGARNVVQADRSMRRGDFQRSRFAGREVRGSTLGIVGYGNIGRMLTEKAKALGMEVLVYDPMVSEDVISKGGARKVELKECFSSSDYVSLHIPANGNQGLVNSAILGSMKEDAMLINTARAEVVDQEAILKHIQSNRSFRYAVDVHSADVEKNGRPSPFVASNTDQIIITPHLGASTGEANLEALTQAARQVVAYHSDGRIENAVNYVEIPDDQKGYIPLAQALGAFGASLTKGKNVKVMKLRYSGDLAGKNTDGLTNYVVSRLLQDSVDGVTPMNAGVIAAENGLGLSQETSEATNGYTNKMNFEIETDKGKTNVAGTMFGDTHLRIVEVDGVKLEFEPGDNMAVIRHDNTPGMIGYIGTALSEAGINIHALTTAPNEDYAITVLRADQPLEGGALESISAKLGTKMAYMAPIQL